MRINVKADIFELQTMFWKSEGYLAVVDDNNKLLGIYGKKENQFLVTDLMLRKGEDISIDEVLNPHFSSIELSENLEKELEDFFHTYGYAYVPIVSKDGEFVRFERNPDKLSCGMKEDLLRRVIAERWSIYDRFEKFYEGTKLKCLICNYEIDTKNTRKKVCSCLFGGGRLIRYVCPHCGAIVGPLKILNMTEEELAEDYIQHYSVFQEGDTTEDEIHTFFKLQPEKGKKYLNYGCGGDWSKSIATLRAQGFDVYGYEPFAASSSVDYIMTDREALETMRFDGIFSNNLIEHLKNPVEELKFMKTLLVDHRSIMAHSTACYEYLYPYTRFHVCFPIGKSAKIMYEKAGLEIMERSEVILHGDKQICILVKQI